MWASRPVPQDTLCSERTSCILKGKIPSIRGRLQGFEDSRSRRTSVLEFLVVMAGRITAFLLMCAVFTFGIMAIAANQDATARGSSVPASAANEDARIDPAVLGSLVGGGIG
ncbi:uncharacterized protein [Dermacentor albipictus]|uniref:uncharacterized protein isoform X2 n=1 Tax=Dermacentor albipictus TaxID=60249 RepID=UPI0038FCC03B